MKIKKLLLWIAIVAGVSIVVGYFIKDLSNQLQTRVGWQTMNDTGLSFQYPPQLSTTYIHTTEWPPKIQIKNQIANKSFSCKPEENKIINKTTYCVSTQAEGAAGSAYTKYIYSVAKSDNVVTLTFTLRSAQCLNYDEPKKSACINERNTFSVDDLAEQILSSVRLK